jgi:parallel beta-helix repeat protein
MRIEMKKALMAFFTTLCLLSTLLLVGFVSNVQIAKASGTIYIRADGSIEGTTDIMTVDNVTYTFTDNISNEIIIERDDIVVDGAGYILQGTGSELGIYLLLRNNVTVKNTEIKNFWAGIQLSFSSNNKISGNNITEFDYCGILMDLYASNNIISGNTITEPIQPECRGIYLGQNSGNNIISGNYIVGFWSTGIRSEGSSNNIISGNTIKDNLNGVWLSGGSNNRIYHNNFIGLPNPCFFPDDHASTLTFDAGYPLGGNYWHVCYNNGYKGADLFSGVFQNETGSDGIGDTPHLMLFDNEDSYPLMGMFSEFNATSEHRVQTICNSSISDFQCNGTTIGFNVTGETDTTGFCRICIPRALMNETYVVFVNGTEVQCNLLPCSNSTHSYLYFTYNHSAQEVIIIPEFPSILILPLFVVATLLIVIVYRRKYWSNPCVNH